MSSLKEVIFLTKTPVKKRGGIKNMFSFGFLLETLEIFYKLELDELERVKLRTKGRLGLNIDFWTFEVWRQRETIMPKLSNLELTLDQKVNIAKMIKIIDSSTNVKLTRKLKRTKQIESKEALDEQLDNYWQQKKQTDVHSLD